MGLVSYRPFQMAGPGMAARNRVRILASDAGRKGVDQAKNGCLSGYNELRSARDQAAVSCSVENLVTDPRVPPYSEPTGDGPESTALSLLAQLRVSRPDGWRRLAALYGPLIYSWCRQMNLQDHDASDVVQDVLRTVMQNIGGFRRERPGDSFRGWLRTITRNKVRDLWRKRAADPDGVGGTTMQMKLMQLPDAEACPRCQDQELREIRQIYHRALAIVRDEFEVTTWQAFWRVVVDGRAAVDVAADLSVSTNAVYIAKSRVLSRLRAEFAELIDWDDCPSKKSVDDGQD